jgi:hypothetical protein
MIALLRVEPRAICVFDELCAVLRRSAGGGKGDGAGRGMVTIVELIDPRPYNFQPPVYGRLIYTVIYMSDGLLTQANPDSRFLPRLICAVQTRRGDDRGCCMMMDAAAALISAT